MKTKIDYKLWIHKSPADLNKPLSDENSHLDKTSDLHKELIDSPLAFPVWQIDMFDERWIAIDRFNGTDIEHHTLRIDADTFVKTDSEEYEIEKENR